MLAGSWLGNYETGTTNRCLVLRVLSSACCLNQNRPLQQYRYLAECANRVADTLSELGYDHAGPLYHEILKSAKSDGAFYTENTSALMLARLALSKGYRRLDRSGRR